MRLRSLLLALTAVALLAPATPGFAQGQGRGPGIRGGKIKSVDASAKSFVVTIQRMGQEADVTVTTNAETRFIKGTAAGAFTDVAAGKWAFFTGRGMPAEGITAREVIVLEKEAFPAFGAIKSVDASAKSFVVSVGRQQMRDVTIKVTDKTHYRSGRETGKWDDIAVGKNVIIIGEGNPRESLTAIHVHLVPVPGGGNQ